MDAIRGSSKQESFECLKCRHTWQTGREPSECPKCDHPYVKWSSYTEKRFELEAMLRDAGFTVKRGR